MPQILPNPTRRYAWSLIENNCGVETARCDQVVPDKQPAASAHEELIGGTLSCNHIRKWIVDHFDFAQAFIERCDRATHVKELAATFQQSLEALGFRHFACCSHVDPLRPPRRSVMLHTYPEAWVRCFSELRFYEFDPVFLRAEQSRLPFHWDAPDFLAELTPPQQEVLAEAGRLGITRGYTIPIQSVGAAGPLRASCSVVPDSTAIDASSYFTVRLMGTYLYEAASRDAQAQDPAGAAGMLSRRERQCLELAAQGKSDWVVGRLLNISERTVHNHIESAKRRLGVATRVQAIVNALASGQVSFGDVIRPQSPERAENPRTTTRTTTLCRNL
jgi:DNA-binding CsgD family transcriptional regulator